MTRGIVLLVALLLAPVSWAAIDAYEFPDEDMRDRYHQLIDELRCPQCLNTNIAGSDAMISKDLRREVHRLLLEGHSDDEVLEFMQARYGDFILYEPRVKPGTYALWFLPPLLLVSAVIFVIVMLRNRRRQPAMLSEEESARLKKLTNHS